MNERIRHRYYAKLHSEDMGRDQGDTQEVAVDSIYQIICMRAALVSEAKSDPTFCVPDAGQTTI